MLVGAAAAGTACALVFVATSRAAFAAPAPRDALAKGQLESARKAYALGKFDAAEKALADATKTCKKPTDCSLAIVATIHRDRGVLLAQAKNDAAGAKESFKRALEIDPQTVPPPSLSSPKVIEAFEAAKAPPKPAVDPSAPPPPPPPPPPEPKPLREVPATKAQFQRGVGLIVESPAELPVEHGTTGPGPIVAAKPPVTGAWVHQFAFGYALATFSPSVEGFEPCPKAKTHSVAFDFEWDRHVPGTVVGHRLRLPMSAGFGASASPPDCGDLDKGPDHNALSFQYGLDFHAPLPGVLHGLSIGPFVGPEVRMFMIKNSLEADAKDTSVNLAVLGGGHARFRYGHPETGFNAYIDAALRVRSSVVEGSYTGTYQRFELKLAWKSIGLLGYLESRVSADGGPRPFETNAQYFSHTASLADLKGISLVIN